MLGSRNRSNGGDIFVYNPQDFGALGNETVPATADFTCSGGSVQPGPHYSGGTLGTILSRAAELAGPNSADNAATVPNGFAPCAYRVPATGIYGVVFAPASSGGLPNGAIDPLALSNSAVAAWDVTVRAGATSTADIDGRLFTYAFSGSTGGFNRPVYPTHYYITGDGYRYRQDSRGLDPASYVLYANPFGFVDSGQPLYKDLRGQDAPSLSNLPPGVVTQAAEYPIFFSDVSPGGANASAVDEVLGVLGIPVTPLLPAVSGFAFSGTGPGSVTAVGAGGTFRFSATNTTSCQIVVSRDGATFDPNDPRNRVLTGVARTGSHAMAWDGKDGAGANFPAGTYPAQITCHSGEAHFPMIDAENNPNGGPTVTRLNGLGAPDRTVYFDDRGYITRGGTMVGNPNGTLCPTATPAAPNPPVRLDGVDSATAYRVWQSGGNRNLDCNSVSGWGDAKGVDLWAYFGTSTATGQLTVVQPVIDVATAVTAINMAAPGGTVQGSFSFANNGTGPAADIAYDLQLAANLGTVTFGNLPAGVTAGYDNATGRVTFAGLPATLGPGQSFSGMTFSHPAPASGPVTATTTISTTSTDILPANNTASAVTRIGATDVFARVSVPANAAPGTPVNGTITFGNHVNATTAAQGVTYSATIGGPGNYPAAVTFTGLPPGATATYDPGNGRVTFAGMPAAPAPSQSLNIGFSYTGPGSGSVPVTAGITTTSTDADPANNVASGATSFSQADLGVTKTNGVARLPAGAQTTYTVVATNLGPAAADGAVITDPVAVGLSKTAVTCAASGGAACPANPTVAELEGGGVVIPGLPVNGSLTFTIAASVTAAAGTTVTNATQIAPPSGVIDPAPGNDTASDSDPVAPSGTVSGAVFDDPDGDGVRDAGESGLGGVTVELLDGGGNVVATTTTGADGGYSFPGVTPGAYAVRETDPAGFTSTTLNTVPVNVSADGAATASFGDQRQGTVSGAVFDDPDGNGVRGSGESGLGGVTVELLDGGGNVVATATTGADGSYSFPGVTAGAYTVRETDPAGFVSTSPNGVPVSVAPGGAATASFGDQMQGTVSGTVFNDLDGDGARGPGEAGIGGVTVTLTPTGGGAPITAVTAGDGSYLFAGATPGAYTVRETDPAGFVSTSPNGVSVSVAPGGAATANFGDQRQGTVSGSVFSDLDGDGARGPGESGLGGVTVELLDGGGNVVATATTGADGGYSFPGVTAGAYTVRETDPAGFVSTSPNGVPVSVAPGGAATASFGDQMQGTVSGTVFNDLDGDGARGPGEAGIGGVTVTLAPTGGGAPITVVTAGDGSYLFIGVTPGSYTVTETDPAGFTSTTLNAVPVNVSAGGAATASFGDQRTGTVAGAVFSDLNGNGARDPGEPGIGGVRVELLNGQGNVIATATTTGDGRYVFTDVPPGTYTARETDPDGFVSTTPNTRTVVVPPSGNASTDFGDQMQGTVSGAVFNDLDGDGTRDPGEPGIGGVAIELIDAGGRVVATTVTAGNGDYSFAGVAPGNYAVRETDPDGFASTTPNTVPVTIPAGGSISVQFGDRRSPQGAGAIVSVVFNDLNGNGTQDAGEPGLPGVTVFLDSNGNGALDPGETSTVTDADGNYRFTGLPPDTYTVTFVPPPNYTLTTNRSNSVTVRPGETVANASNFGLQLVTLPPDTPTDIPALSEVAALVLLVLLLLTGWRSIGQTASRRTRG